MNRKILVAFCVLVITASGYAIYSTMGASAADADEPSISMLDIQDLGTFELPLDTYIDSGVNERFRKSVKAQALLTNKCLSRFGVKGISTEDLHAPPYRGYERAWGIYNAGEAAKHGYDTPTPNVPPGTQLPPGQLAVEPNPTPPSTPPASVMFGEGTTIFAGKKVPPGGCSGEAERTVNAGLPDDIDLDFGRELATTTAYEEDKDSRVRRVVAAWSSCMAKSGFDYSHPWEANDDPAFATPKASDREIAVAKADVNCKKAVNYVNVRASVALAYQQRAIERNSDKLAALRIAFKRRLNNVDRVLSAQ